MRRFIQFGWYETSSMITVMFFQDGVITRTSYMNWKHALVDMRETLSFSDCPVIVNLLALGE